MDETLVIKLLIFLICLLASAFFSGSEAALFSLSRGRLLSYQAESDSRPKRLIVQLMTTHHRTLTSIILCNMFVNTAISATSADLFRALSTTIGVSDTGLVILNAIFSVCVLLVFCEVTPMVIAYSISEKYALRAATPLYIIRFLLTPILAVVDRILGFVLNGMLTRKSLPLNQQEYQTFVELAYAGGAFTDDESRLMSQALSLEERTVAAVMTSRMDIGVVSPSDTPEMVAATIRRVRHAFLAVAPAGDLDAAELILSTKDFFMLETEQRRQWDKSGVVSPALFVPLNADLSRTLATMKNHKRTVALVADEYGGISGIITLEDIYEELVGTLDDENQATVWDIQQIAPNSWTAPARLPLYAIEDKLKWDSGGEYQAITINGLISEVIGRLPVQGDSVTIKGLTFTVTRMRRSRIHTVQITRYAVDPTELAG